ncbi:MAG: hypothetical protein L0215_02695 [Gemmataceae bacterium]|nr:hypothetical protein [Gemmataceae bacterium]
MTHEQFRELILPHLYGLLSEQEAADFAAHLASSAEARAALEAVREKQTLLAEAAKESFTEVSFAPPKETLKAHAAPATAKMPKRPRERRNTWMRWAVAASLLFFFLAIGGIFSIAGWNYHKNQYTEATQRFDKASFAVIDLQNKIKEESRKARVEIDEIKEQIRKLVDGWNNETENQKRVLRDRSTQVIINGPRNLQAGGANDFQIDVQPKSSTVQAKKAAFTKSAPSLVAKVVNPATKEVLFQKELNQARGRVNIQLPRDLPVKPGMDLALVVETKAEDGAPVEVREHLKLIAPEYMTHLYTDRPMYRPGEVVHFRSLTLERFSLKPAQEPLRLRFRVTGPNGVEFFKGEGSAELVHEQTKQPVKGPDGEKLTGLGAGEWAIPPELPGGQYLLHVSEANDRFQAEKRAFLINQWQAPRFNKEIIFDRSSYGPGDNVVLTARAARAEGGPMEPLEAHIHATVDGQVVQNNTLRTDPAGNLTFSFALNVPMTRGDGMISIRYSDGGTVDTIVRPIPIVLNRLQVEFYPEGGDLIAGLPNRVYFQARTTTGKPADMRGRIVDDKDVVVANIHTLSDDQEPGVNQGMGRFEFTPELGRSYQLKIDSPIKMHGKGGKQYSYLLPKVKRDGVVLRIPQGVADDTIDVQVTSAGKNRDLLVGVYCRGKLLDHLYVEAKADKPAGVTLRPTHGIGGVFRVTVFEKLANGAVQPMAERLLYRRAPQKLQVTARTDKEIYYPGDRVQLTLAAENEKKEFAPAIALVAVADLSVHKLANDKTARAMPTHFLLTSEVRQPEDLEYADFFLGHHPKAAQALDLLLGVQGWRRFAEQDPNRFQNNRDAARFLLAMAPGGRQTNNPEKDVLDQLDAKFAPEFIMLQKKLAGRESAENGTPETIQDLITQQTLMNTHQGNIQNTYSRLDDYERMLGRIGLGLLVVFTLLGGLLCLYGGMKRMARGRSGVGFFVVGGCILLFLIMGSLAGTFYLMGSRNNMRDDIFMDVRGPVAMKVAVAPPPPMMMAPGMPNVGLGPEGVAEGPPGVDMAKAVPLEKEVQWFGANAQRPNAAAQPMMAPMAQAGGMGMPPGGGIPGGPPMGGFGGGGMAGMAMPGMVEPGMEGGGLMMPGGPGAPIAFDPERRLRMQGNFKELIQQRLGRAVSLPSASDPFLVREYAHARGLRQEEVRTDFTETLLWQPAFVLQDGKGSLAFDLSDASTRFQVVVFGHTLDGRIGAATIEFSSRLPVSIEPKMPIEVTSSDRIQIPLAIANDSNKSLPVGVQVFPKNLKWITDEKQLPLPGRGLELTLDPKSREREVFEFQPTIVQGLANLRFSADFGELGKDVVERSFKIVPEGFPVAGSASGLLEKSATHFFELPEKIVPDTLKCQVQVFPSTLAELQKGLDSLLREPCGCFEQSSTSNYPNVLILNYLREADLANPELEKRSRQLLNSGYAKLTSFECLDPKETSQRRGYEWFGQTAPPHEALTAYGLLQFRDMARVHPVDEEMLKRTQAYLLGQRDGKGGFKRNPRALDSFGRAPEHVTNAYIFWALTESKIEEDLGTELKALEEKAKDAKDPYFLALVAAGHLNAGKSNVAVEILKQLREMQKEEGEVAGAATSITGSGGRDLLIETTALATLGWLKANRPDEFHNHIDRAVKWIGKQRGGYGGFGATQSTILALKALIAHTKESKRPVEPGNLVLYVNDRPNPVAVLNFTATAQESITLAVPKGDYLVAGKNRLRVEISGKNEFPYTLSWSYQTLKPVNPPKAPVELTATLNKTEAKEGDTVRLSATVENKSGKGQGMAVAILGLPGGLALPEDMAQLKEMAALREDGAKPGVISSWELRGRELVLYWRDLAPDAKIELSLDLVCRVPGVYTGPASRAYLYYNADDKYWADPLAVTIRP